MEIHTIPQSSSADYKYMPVPNEATPDGTTTTTPAASNETTTAQDIPVITHSATNIVGETVQNIVTPEIRPETEDRINEAVKDYSYDFEPAKNAMSGRHTATIVVATKDGLVERTIKYNSLFEDQRSGKISFYGGSTNMQQCNVYTDSIVCAYYDRTPPKED